MIFTHRTADSRASKKSAASKLALGVSKQHRLTEIHIQIKHRITTHNHTNPSIDLLCFIRSYLGPDIINGPAERTKQTTTDTKCYRENEKNKKKRGKTLGHSNTCAFGPIYTQDVCMHSNTIKWTCHLLCFGSHAMRNCCQKYSALAHTHTHTHPFDVTTECRLWMSEPLIVYMWTRLNGPSTMSDWNMNALVRFGRSINCRLSRTSNNVERQCAVGN